MALGTFLRFAIEVNGGDAGTLISSALAHYREALDAAEPPVGVPSFLAPSSGHLTEVSLPLDPALERLLRNEAARQHVGVERLVSHAVFLYLADLDRAEDAAETC